MLRTPASVVMALILGMSACGDRLPADSQPRPVPASQVTPLAQAQPAPASQISTSSPPPAPASEVTAAEGAATCDGRIVVVVDPSLHGAAAEGLYASRRWCAYAEGSTELYALPVWHGAHNLESEQRAAGCACTAQGLSTGIIKLQRYDGRVMASVLCGSIWNPVKGAKFLPRKRDKPGAAGRLPRLLAQVLDHGWPRRSVCLP